MLHGHQRRSIRLRNYDYATTGAYFVTICVHNHESRLGTIANDVMMVNETGAEIDRWWQELPTKFPSVELDAYVIMPNHMHGIIALLGDSAPTHTPTLGDVVGWFKTMTTNAYIRGVKAARWPRFDKYFWQRNYWDHIIRDDRSLKSIRRYIELNPQKWTLDIENPNPDWIERMFGDSPI